MADKNINKYSLYDGREIAGPAINWGTVAADTANALSTISKDRQARRQKIEDDTGQQWLNCQKLS